jgi:hypothetical protein
MNKSFTVKGIKVTYNDEYWDYIGLRHCIVTAIWKNWDLQDRFSSEIRHKEIRFEGGCLRGRKGE